MKAIILARVSDKKQDSNEAQVVRVLDYVKYKGLTIWRRRWIIFSIKIAVCARSPMKYDYSLDSLA